MLSLTETFWWCLKPPWLQCIVSNTVPPVTTAISCPSFPLHHEKLTSPTAVLQGCLVHQQAVVSCRCLLSPVVAEAADVIEGGRRQDTEGQAGEATQEGRAVESPCSEAAGDLPGVAFQAKATVGKNFQRAQPLWQ